MAYRRFKRASAARVGVGATPRGRSENSVRQGKPLADGCPLSPAPIRTATGVCSGSGAFPDTKPVKLCGRALARRLQQAHAAGGATGLQTLIGLLLFLRGYDGLTCVAAFPDSRARHEFSSAAAALLRHGLL